MSFLRAIDRFLFGPPGEVSGLIGTPFNVLFESSMFKSMKWKTPKPDHIWSKDVATTGAAVTPTPSDGTLTFIGAGSEIRGNLCAAGHLRIDGAVYGTVRVEGDLEVSPPGSVEGEDIRARNVLVHGRVQGKLYVTEQLRIHGHGRVDGDVTAQSLDIEAGAHFVGYSRTRVEQEVEALQLAPGASAADAQQGTDFR